MTHLAYRAEIDGLRAVAVLSVVFYHSGFGLSSGYVGVDVFFVISGYLITALLHAEWLNSGRIDFSRFFARRFRRLFPAVVFVLVWTVLVSALVFSSANEVYRVTQSATAFLVFVANFYFQNTTGGYFDGNSQLILLLHLWSLSVEEQFYLVWPVLLILILRLRSVRWVPALATIGLVSLITSELMMASEPEVAFFQMPSRFWEFAVGGLIAIAPFNRLWDGRFLAALGLLVLLVSMFRQTGHFPGTGALPAVAGTALLLIAIRNSTQLGITGTALRSPPMVFFGQISYSLYLWHWPLFAIYGVSRAGQVGVEMRLLLCLASVVVAWFSYLYIERPFRVAESGVSDRRLVAAGLTACLSLAVAISGFGRLQEPAELPTDLASVTARDMPENRFNCHFRGGEDPVVFPKSGCSSDVEKSVRVAIWGDSMALAWQPLAWVLALRDGVAATTYTRDSCPPVINYSNGKRSLEDDFCRDFNGLVMAKVKNIDTLVLAGNWSGYLGQTVSGTRETDFEARLNETLRTMAPQVRRIFLVGPTPRLKDTAPRCIRTSSLEACAFSRREFENENAEARALLLSVSATFPNVT